MAYGRCGVPNWNFRVKSHRWSKQNFNQNISMVKAREVSVHENSEEE